MQMARQNDDDDDDDIKQFDGEALIALENAEYLFIAISPRFTLARSGTN